MGNSRISEIEDRRDYAKRECQKLEAKYRLDPCRVVQLQWTPGDRNHYSFYKNELDTLNWVLERLK